MSQDDKAGRLAKIVANLKQDLENSVINAGHTGLELARLSLTGDVDEKYLPYANINDGNSLRSKKNTLVLKPNVNPNPSEQTRTSEETQPGQDDPHSIT